MKEKGREREKSTIDDQLVVLLGKSLLKACVWRSSNLKES